MLNVTCRPFQGCLRMAAEITRSPGYWADRVVAASVRDPVALVARG